MKLLTKDTHVVHRRQIRVGFNCDNRSGSILKIIIGKTVRKKYFENMSHLWPGSGTREHGCEEHQLGKRGIKQVFFRIRQEVLEKGELIRRVFTKTTFM